VRGNLLVEQRCPRETPLAVVVASGRGEQKAAGVEDASEFGDRRLGIGHVVEARGGDHAVERAVVERQLPHVGEDGRHAGPSGELDHPRRGIDGYDLSAELGLRPHAEVTEPRADVEQPAGPCGEDPRPHDLLVVWALAKLAVCERTLPIGLLRRVLLGDRPGIRDPVGQLPVLAVASGVVQRERRVKLAP
jgi:hypothetical protein